MLLMLMNDFCVSFNKIFSLYPKFCLRILFNYNLRIQSRFHAFTRGTFNKLATRQSYQSRRALVNFLLVRSMSQSCFPTTSMRSFRKLLKFKLFNMKLPNFTCLFCNALFFQQVFVLYRYVINNFKAQKLIFQIHLKIIVFKLQLAIYELFN